MSSYNYHELQDQAWLQKMYVEDGKTTHEIGALLNCPASTVARALHRLKIPVRFARGEKDAENTCAHCHKTFPVGGRDQPKRNQSHCSAHCSMMSRVGVGSDTIHQESWLRQKYIDERLSTVDIAILSNCAVRTVCRSLKELNIPIRSASEAATGKKMRRVDAPHSSSESSVDLSRLKNRGYGQKIKLEMIEAYGGCCACCGEKEPALLSLDHTHGGGMKDRKENGGQAGVLRRLKAEGWPKDNYRCLCMSCNTATKYGRECPHETRRRLAPEYSI